jgi:hypothetical protein
VPVAQPRVVVAIAVQGRQRERRRRSNLREWLTVIPRGGRGGWSFADIGGGGGRGHGVGLGDDPVGIGVTASAQRASQTRATRVGSPRWLTLGRITEAAAMTLRYVVGIRTKNVADQVTVEAEDALGAALKAKAAHPEAAVTYVRKQNTRGDRRHPHGTQIEGKPAEPPAQRTAPSTSPRQ